MKYLLMKDGSVMREGDLALIPPSEENPDWLAYLADKSKTVEPFDYATEEARQAVAESEKKRRDIDTQRDAAINSGFTHDGILWHCDPTFQAQIQGFILAYSTGVLPPAATVTIRSKANTNHQLGQSQIIALAAALMQHVQGIYAASWVEKDKL